VKSKLDGTIVSKEQADMKNNFINVGNVIVNDPTLRKVKKSVVFPRQGVVTMTSNDDKIDVDTIINATKDADDGMWAMRNPTESE